ncbi:DUF1349 domain-containing protein [Microbacterium sulfonylureivorans]|uniref:DUF1349 domain-containing protein n=1 Tax=Microbacterium sulfonylureivorans TaxID=2486854 RepID=UPI001F0B9AB9|nr:DUF1349 domain-containing protein [Microbacterium sulfonylureivorans]
MTSPLAVPGLPFPLLPSDESRWRMTAEAVAVTAAAHSDLFADPSGDGQTAAESQLNAATLLGDGPVGDFTFSARVRVGFEATFDAGVLLIWVDERHWAKLCVELSPDREPMVVSVVTRGVSDDANAFVVTGPDVRLRVSRIGQVFAFHASTDGRRWAFVRAFSLPGAETARIGFEAQSPMGDGCEVSFADVEFAQRTLADLRDGS